VSRTCWRTRSRRELTRIVRCCLAKLTAELAKNAGIERDDVLEVTLVGNPIMHHLVLGLDPTELGGAPFALAVEDALRLRAADLGLPVHPGARAYILPCIAGHVGADTAGMILSEAPYLGDEVNLLVDVGTNAEIVLGNRERLLAASSPTGPAFEGAQITFGQRAAPGAIERVRIDPETLEPRVRVIGCDAWSNEPGFAGVQVTGICGSGIIEALAESAPRRDPRRTAPSTRPRGLPDRSSRTVAFLVRAARRRATAPGHRRTCARSALRALRGMPVADGSLQARPRGPHPARGCLRADRPVHALVLGLIRTAIPSA
jgi:hypothetical protein